MKLKDIYKTAVDFGIKMDPRGEEFVKAALKEEKKRFEALPEKEKKYYDEEKLVNPYADSRILFDAGNEVKSVLVGIDMEVAELLLAERLGEKGKKIDAIIGHHPTGMAFAKLDEVMGMQADIFNLHGVNIAAAEGLTAKRAKDVGEKLMPANHYRTYGAAKLLNISVMNMHTLTDNCVATYLQKRFDKERPGTVGDVVDMIFEEPEYKKYAKRGVPPVVLTGDKSRKVKKVFVDMTGGTEGPQEIYKKLSEAGVDTIVGMHFSPDHKKAIEEAKLNSVIAGHISSDALGINVMLDAIESKLGKLNVYETSGFVRFSRKTKRK